MSFLAYEQYLSGSGMVLVVVSRTDYGAEMSWPLAPKLIRVYRLSAKLQRYLDRTTDTEHLLVNELPLSGDQLQTIHTIEKPLPVEAYLIARTGETEDGVWVKIRHGNNIHFNIRRRSLVEDTHV